MTLFVDSSLHPPTGAAGYGAWAKRDDWGRGRFSGGPITLKKGRLDNSNETELAGIALALWYHHKEGNLENVFELMIQCDNTAALAFILNRVPKSRVIRTGNAFIRTKPKNKNPIVPVVLDTIADLVKGKQVALRHIKGHQGGELAGRAWVNMQCDQEARRHMLAQRKYLESSALLRSTG